MSPEREQAPAVTVRTVLDLSTRVFWIFVPNFIKIDPYNFDLYRFKVVAFFETQCSMT